MPSASLQRNTSTGNIRSNSLQQKRVSTRDGGELFFLSRAIEAISMLWQTVAWYPCWEIGNPLKLKDSPIKSYFERNNERWKLCLKILIQTRPFELEWEWTELLKQRLPLKCRSTPHLQRISSNANPLHDYTGIWNTDPCQTDGHNLMMFLYQTSLHMFLPSRLTFQNTGFSVETFHSIPGWKMAYVYFTRILKTFDGNIETSKY